MKRFCRDAHHLRLVRGGSSIEEEYSGNSAHSNSVAKHFEQERDSAALYYFVLRGVDRFVGNYCAVPGSRDVDVEPDIGRLKTCVQQVLSEYQLPLSTCKDDDIHEVCRYGGAELHSIASIVGGCAAQEVIKLLTNQYVPVNNLFIYNSMTSATVTLKV